MEDLNNVPSSGTYGAAINEVNTNFSLIVNAINSLEYATTKSKGIYNNGFTPSSTTLPNSASGDWCMVLGTGNTFPARIWTYNGTTWAQGGTWNPDGINLNDYATTSALNTAVANSLAQATARMGYGVATASNNAYSVTITNYTLPTNGGVVRVKMPTAATGAATLDITNTGAKTIWYNGKAVSSTNTWEAEEIISVFYDGTKYMSSNSQGGGVDAEKIKYDNSQSGLASTNVQEALDTLSDEIGDTIKTKQVATSTAQLDIIDEQGYVIGRFKDGWFKTRYFDADFESRIDLLRTFLCDIVNTGIDTRKRNIGQIFRISPDSKILLKNSSSYYGLVAIGRESMMLNWSNDVIFNSGWKKGTDIELDNSNYNGDIVFVFFQDTDGQTQMTNEKIAANFSLFITNRKKYDYNDSLSACVGAKAVAHRGVHVNDIPENSVDSYRAAIRCGMDMIEADINVTSDGGYIMYHDTSLTSTYVTKADGTSIGSAVAISSKTFDYIRETYRLKSDNPAYIKPLPSLDEYLDICKKGKAYAFPELKGTWTNAQLSDVLQKCKQMLGVGNFCIQGQNAAYLDYIRSLDEYVDVCYMYLDIRNTTNTITGQGRFTSHTHAMLTESNMDAALVKDYRANGSEVFDGTLVTPNTFNNVINTYCYPNCITNTCGSNLNGKNGIHISLDTNWYDFKTNGTIANGVLTIETGQYIAYTSPFVFLGSMILNVSYKGSMTIRSQSSNTSLGINKTVSSMEVFSQITERPLVYKNCGSFLITATSNTVIDMIDFQFAEF